MPDFNEEEKASIEKDAGEMRTIIAEMAECMPKEDPDKGSCTCHLLGAENRLPTECSQDQQILRFLTRNNRDRLCHRLV